MVEKYGALPTRNARCELSLVCWMKCVVEFAVLHLVIAICAAVANRVCAVKRECRILCFPSGRP